MQQAIEFKNPPFSTQIMSWHEDALMAQRKKLTDAIDNIKQAQAKNQPTCAHMLTVYEGGIMLIDDEMIRRSLENQTVADAINRSAHGRSVILRNYLEKQIA